MQAVAGGVEINFHGVLAQGKAHLVQCAILGQGADLVAVHQALDDGLFDDALAGGHAGQLAGQARALDREGRVGGEQLLPRDNVRPALERHAAIGDLDVLCAQTLDLKIQRRLRAEKAGRDHGIKCRHRCPFLLMCRLFCRGEHCSPAGGQ